MASVRLPAFQGTRKNTDAQNPTAILSVERPALVDPTEPDWQRLATPQRTSEVVAREETKKDIEKAIQQKLEEAHQVGLWYYDTSFKFPIQPRCLDSDC